MATKPLTIMADAYNLLAQNKMENESFSEEIRRIFTKKPKKSLMDYFGILNKEEGEELRRNVMRIREENLRMLKREIREGFR